MSVRIGIRIAKLMNKSFSQRVQEIAKGGRAGLVLQEIEVHRGGKTFKQKRWVRPGEDTAKPKVGKKDDPEKRKKNYKGFSIGDRVMTERLTGEVTGKIIELQPERGTAIIEKENGNKLQVDIKKLKNVESKGEKGSVADVEVKRGDKAAGVDVNGKKVSGTVTSVGGDGVTIDHKYHVEHGKVKKQSKVELKKPAKNQKTKKKPESKQEKSKKFDTSELTEIENTFHPERPTYLKDNPEYKGSNTGFYLQSYESKKAKAIEKYAESVMDGKPVKKYAAGEYIYIGKIDGRDAIISNHDNSGRYIEIEFKEKNGAKTDQADNKPKKKLGIRVAPKNGNGKGFAGSVAVGDTVTGMDQSGNSITGKVSAKEKTGIVVIDGNGAAHFVEWDSIKHMDKAVSDQDAIRMIYDKEAIIPAWRNGDTGLQPEHCDNIDGLLKAAAAARGDFNAVSDEYAKRFSGLDPLLIKRPVLKGMDRIKEKLRDDYSKGDKNVYEPGPPEVYHTKTIRDTDGHTFTLNNVADVSRMLAAFEKDKRIVRIKNNFADPSTLGYSDINMNVRLPNGTIAEIQLNTTANLVAKERYGHSLYEVWRTIKSDENYSELADIMVEAQKTLYGLSNRDSKSGTYKLSDSVNEAIINGDTGAFFKEEHEEYADAIKPFVEKAVPLFNEAVEKGKIDEKTAGHFKDLVFRLKNA